MNKTLLSCKGDAAPPIMKQFINRDLGCEVFSLESGLFHANPAEANDVKYAGVLAAGLAWGTPFAFIDLPMGVVAAYDPKAAYSIGLAKLHISRSVLEERFRQAG